jgi:adenine-specific DNA-methyltransferase
MNVSTFTHDKALWLNNPTAKFAWLYEVAQAIRLPWSRPLVEGDVRERHRLEQAR